MKKLIFALLLLNLACLFAQKKPGKTNDTEGITGFDGIEFGTTKEKVKQTMTKKGWRYIEGPNYLTVYNATYEGMEFGFGDENLRFYFDENQRFYWAFLVIATNLSNEEEMHNETAWTTNLFKIICSKYNLRYDMRSPPESGGCRVVCKGKNKNIFVYVVNYGNGYGLSAFSFISEKLFIGANMQIGLLYDDLIFMGGGNEGKEFKLEDWGGITK